MSYHRHQWFLPITALLMGVVFGLLVGLELVVRRADPQEANGWGERASLAPHPVFAYHLQPSRTTRLRWESYDYTVTANALGFPGPDVDLELVFEARNGSQDGVMVGNEFQVDVDRRLPPAEQYGGCSARRRPRGGASSA